MDILSSQDLITVAKADNAGCLIITIKPNAILAVEKQEESEQELLLRQRGNLICRWTRPLGVLLITKTTIVNPVVFFVAVKQLSSSFYHPKEYIISCIL